MAGDVGKLFECPARRGARGSEIVKLCLGCARRRAALALPGACAREGVRVPGGARARRAPVSRVLVRRAPRASAGAVRPAAGQRLDERGAPAVPSRSGASRGRGRVCVREEEGSGGVRKEGGPAGGRERGGGLLGAPARAAVSLHVTATQNQARPESSIFCVWEVFASSVPTAGAGGDRL